MIQRARSSTWNFCTLHHCNDTEIPPADSSLSKQGKGAYTTAVVNFTYATLDMFSPRAGAIHDQLMRSLSEMDASKLPPGRMEQLRLQATRYQPGDGSPCVEFIFFPAFLSVPSTCSRQERAASSKQSHRSTKAGTAPPVHHDGHEQHFVAWDYCMSSRLCPPRGMLADALKAL